MVKITSVQATVIAVLLLVLLAVIVVACSSDKQAEQAIADRQTDLSQSSSSDMRWTELNDWYIRDSNSKSGISRAIRQTYGEIGLRKPSVSDFAYGCVIARHSGYIYPKPPYMSYANTVSKFGYTERDEYDIGIAYILTELDTYAQRNWCNKIVELHNLDPWDGQTVPWSN